MRLRDSLSGELRELEPGPDGAIGMYVCGPTVYGRIHVGNARPFVVFLLMKRYLEWRGQRGVAGREHHRHQRQDLRRGARAAACRPTSWLAR